ncbi:MAG TPA: DUF2252 domain-containing protein [Gaiellaceae bacterium]|nr:DUF2252 domain-containing protein [Gaiellaceae bacterium]
MATQTLAQRAQVGRAARKQVPRASQSELQIAADRDPIGLLEEQARSRVPELVPIRYGRMLVSPFAFLRGAAIVMAHDLVDTPVAGLSAQLCGDAHLANFGGFASPERDLVFDLNDFDETLPGPFEWDVKRLATSFEVAGRERGFADGERSGPVLAVTRTYRQAMHRFAAVGDLDVWYSRLDAGLITARLSEYHDRKAQKTFQKRAAKAQTRDRMRALAKLTERVDGKPRLISDPPLIVPLRELVEDEAVRAELQGKLRHTFGRYLETIPRDLRTLLEGFEYADLARKVVGVGSVGTRCWVLLLFGRDEQDPLFLQIKEADTSVLEPLVGRSRFGNHGRRVVEGQRLMQAASDIFLGWVRTDITLDGEVRDFYFRQLWDWKASADLDTIRPEGLAGYAEACGWTLARAHARSGDRFAISAYLGKGDSFDRAIAAFATAYADLNERDHDALAQAVKAGRIKATEGV